MLSFPPHLVQDYLDRFGMVPGKTVLDPFAGTGTTLVECKKRGIGSAGIESNPMAQFASSVKLDWSVAPAALSDYAAAVADCARSAIARDGYSDWNDLPLFTSGNGTRVPLRSLAPEQSRLLLKDSISPLPLHKTLVLLDAIDTCGDAPLPRYGRLALASALVRDIGNLKFGPEVGVGKLKEDVPVVDCWLAHVRTMIDDLSHTGSRVVGFLMFVVWEIGPHDRGHPVLKRGGNALTEAKIIAFGVPPAHRRQGIGRALQEHVLRRARALGCYQVRSVSRGSRQANHQLKLSMGFAVEPMERDDPSVAFAMPLRADRRCGE